MPLERCILFAGGDLERPEVLKERLTGKEYILAADGGVRHVLAMGLKPQRVVGDMDTLTEGELKDLRRMGVETAMFPKEKDESDTFLALRDAVESGYREIEIWGALGGRFDHALANVILLAHPLAWIARVRLITWNQRMFVPEKGRRISGSPGDWVSLFALGGPVTGIRAEGLRYSPKGGRLTPLDPVGLSNVMTADECAVYWEQGVLLFVHTLVGAR
jgi:thiamine pyrophosphokinase